MSSKTIFINKCNYLFSFAGTFIFMLCIYFPTIV